MTTTIGRDYSILGPEGPRAAERGLVGATWFTPDIDRKRMKELMRRSDRRALVDTALWLGLLVAFGGLGSWLFLRGSLWWIPVLVLGYGPLYGTAGDSRWHEAGHGTAFRTRWMNETVYQDRLLLHGPIADGLAVEPHPPPHRHDHRRSGSGDHHPSTTSGRPSGPQPLRPDRRPARPAPDAASRHGPHHRGPEAVRARIGVPEGAARGQGVVGDLRRRPRRCADLVEPAAAPACPRTPVLRDVAPPGVRRVPTPRAGRGRARPPTQLSNHPDEPGVPVPLSEHELSRRAPHLPKRAVSRPARTPRRGEGPAGPVYPSLAAAYREIIPTLARQRRDPSYFVERPLPGSGD